MTIPLTPKEILRKQSILISKTTAAVQKMPDNQPVTISPELVAQLKQLFKTED